MHSRQLHVYDLRNYFSRYHLTEDDIKSFPSIREHIEWDYEIGFSDRDTLFRNDFTEEMLSCGVFHVADPLVRAGVLLKSTAFSDICFVVGKEKIRFEAHKFILAMASPVFFRMFFGWLPEQKVIHVPDILPESFQILLEYIYTGLLPKFVMAEVGISALYAARKYLLERLEDLLELILRKRVDEENVFLLYEASIFYELAALRGTTQVFIDANISQLITMTEFLKIDEATLAEILKSNNLQAKEMDLYNALLNWSSVDRFQLCIFGSKISQGLPSLTRLYPLLKYIRFPTMSATEFANGPGCSGYLSKEDIGTVLLYICSTDGIYLDTYKFNPKPRNNNLNLSVPKCFSLACECEKNGIGCSFCFPPRKSERWVNPTAPIRRIGVSNFPQRNRGRPPSAPTPHCACQARGFCQRNKGRRDWGDSLYAQPAPIRPSPSPRPGTPPLVRRRWMI